MDAARYQKVLLGDADVFGEMASGVPIEVTGKVAAQSDDSSQYEIRSRNYTQEEIYRNSLQLQRMEPIATAYELPGNGSVRERIEDFFASLGNNVFSEQFGDVELNNASIHSDGRHGSTWNKNITYSVVPNVIKNGAVINVIPKQDSVERVIVAAPVTLPEKREKAYVAVMLKRDVNSQRLYLHDVETEKESTIGGAVSLVTTEAVSSESGLYTTTILRMALNVKENSFSNVQSSLRRRDMSVDEILSSEKGMVRDATLAGQMAQGARDAARSDPARQLFGILGPELREGALVQRIPDALGELIIEIQIVHDGQPHGQHLLRLEQMMQVGFGITSADRAGTFGIDGAFVQLIFRVLEVDGALPCKELGVAGIAGRHDAVKKVDAPGHALDDVAGGADAHEIAGLVLGHIGLHGVQYPVHILRAFPHGQSADGVTGQIQRGDLLHVLNAQILVGRALIDAPELLAGIDGVRLGVELFQRVLAALEPSGRALAGGFGVGVFGGVFHALVKGHGDVGAEIRLDAHTFLRAHEDPVAVQMGGEGHAFLLDLAQTRQ